LTALKQYPEAGRAFATALAEDPASRTVRFDFARFQVERDQPVEALKLLHELVAQQSAEIEVWQFGGQVALSRPEFLEFAGDWTSESIKHFPDHPAIVLQRAEALLLSQNFEGAHALWTQAGPPKSARHFAALALCELLAGEINCRFAPAEEALVSREFLKWYRALIQAGASSLVVRLNERMDDLRAVLPSFFKVWQSAVAEAAQPLPAAEVLAAG